MPFTVRLDAARAPNGHDEEWLVAERLITDAKRWLGHARARRQAIAAYQDALARWRRLDDGFGGGPGLDRSWIRPRQPGREPPGGR